MRDTEDHIPATGDYHNPGGEPSMDMPAPATTAQQRLFAALARKGMRAQGAKALIPEQKNTRKALKAAFKAKAAAERTACPHFERVSVQVPHPRYGDKVAYFETEDRPSTTCGCSPAVVDATAQTEPEGTPVQGDEQCAALTKSGAGPRCTKRAVSDGYCKVHGE
jgi:hypothetical protein